MKSKALIALFSQSGSTARVVEHIVAGLQAAGWDVDTHAITPAGPPSLQGYKLLGIASPTYFFRPPFLVEDFVNALPPLGWLGTFVVALYGTVLGDTANWIRRALRARGARDLGAFHAHGADYWLGYIKRGYLFSPDAPTDQELAAAEAFGQRVGHRAGETMVQVEPVDPPLPLMYRLERATVSRGLVKAIYSKGFKASDACTGCGTCVAACPMDNIALGADNQPQWSSACLLCLSCQLKCPHDAIRSPIDSPIFAPFMSYNIRHAIKAGTPYARVTHTGGSTTRLPLS